MRSEERRSQHLLVLRCMLNAVGQHRTGRPIDNATFRHFLEEAALWRRAHVAATTVVDAAVQALLEGIESESFILIAGLATAEAEMELAELLPAALDELGVRCLGHGDPDNDVLAAAALARSYLSGHIEAAQLAQAIHQTFGHECHPLVEKLSSLDDSFETVDYSPSPSRAELIGETHVAATALQAKADEIYSNAQS